MASNPTGASNWSETVSVQNHLITTKKNNVVATNIQTHEFFYLLYVVNTIGELFKASPNVNIASVVNTIFPMLLCKV